MGRLPCGGWFWLAAAVFWDGGVFLRKGMFFGAQRRGGAKNNGENVLFLPCALHYNGQYRRLGDICPKSNNKKTNG
jgi:hypothetical protein